MMDLRMNRILYLLPVLTLVMCSREEPEKPQTEFSESGGNKVEIKVMSSNVRNGQSDAGIQLWSYRKNAYIAMLSDTQPDIAGMQEAKDNTVSDLSIMSEYSFYRVAEYDGSDPTVTNGHLPPNVIMYRTSKFRMLDAGVFYYNANDPDKPVHYPFGASSWQVRGCVWVKLAVKANGKVIYFFNTHYAHDPDPEDPAQEKVYNIEPRRKASELLVSKMEKLVSEQDAAVFAVGDLNCSLYDNATRNGPYSLEPLNEYMWSAREDAASYDGFISFNGFSLTYSRMSGNIDHIFYRGAEAGDFRTVNGHGYGVEIISDHYPVTCTFKL
jgi:endonuclease/exonuclease/phosphatase family metal-dependent hydrolase